LAIEVSLDGRRGAGPQPCTVAAATPAKTIPAMIQRPSSFASPTRRAPQRRFGLISVDQRVVARELSLRQLQFRVAHLELRADAHLLRVRASRRFSLDVCCVCVAIRAACRATPAARWPARRRSYAPAPIHQIVLRQEDSTCAFSTLALVEKPANRFQVTSTPPEIVLSWPSGKPVKSRHSGVLRR